MADSQTIMVLIEMSKSRSEMRITFAIILMTTALVEAKLWTSGATNGWFSAGVTVGAGLAFIAVALVVGVWLRNRQRRRLLEMRDSALW